MQPLQMMTQVEFLFSQLKGTLISNFLLNSFESRFCTFIDVYAGNRYNSCRNFLHPNKLELLEQKELVWLMRLHFDKVTSSIDWA